MGQKEIPEPNLHVCGEDRTQKMVYKLKEEHVKEDRDRRKRKKAQTEGGEQKKNRKAVLIAKTKTIVAPTLSLLYT